MTEWKTSGWVMFAYSAFKYWTGGTDMQIIGTLAIGVMCFAVQSILTVLAKQS